MTHSAAVAQLSPDFNDFLYASIAEDRHGMPLSILSNIAREAPLGSLLVAFLLGIAVARRRSARGVDLRRE